MKTFDKFKHDMNEGVATLAIPAGVGILKKIATSSALKYAGAGALTGAGYLASKKINQDNNQDKGEEEIKQRKRAEEEEVGKALGKNPGEPLPKIRKRDIIKRGFEKYKEGIKVTQNPTVAKKYRTPEMKGKSPADFVKELLNRQKENMKAKRKLNREIDDKLGK